MAQQMRIEEATPMITARQAGQLKHPQRATWEVQKVGEDGWWIGVALCEDGKRAEWRWVRPVNGRQPKTFATLDGAASWIRLHAKAGRFEVVEGEETK